MTWRNRLKQKFKNSRKGVKHHNIDRSEESQAKKRKSEEECKQELKLLKKSRPSSKTIKKAMDDTAEWRRDWIISDKPSALEVVIKFPCLRVQRWLCREFKSVSGITNISGIETEWQRYANKIIHYGDIEKQSSKVLATKLADVEDDTAKALKILEHFLIPRSIKNKKNLIDINTATETTEMQFAILGIKDSSKIPQSVLTLCSNLK